MVFTGDVGGESVVLYAQHCACRADLLVLAVHCAQQRLSLRRVGNAAVGERVRSNHKAALGSRLEGEGLYFIH